MLGLVLSLGNNADPTLQSYAAAALGNLANHAASQTVVAAAPGAVRELVRLLDSANQPIRQIAASALRNLALCERGRRELAAVSLALNPQRALHSLALRERGRRELAAVALTH